MTGSKDEQIIEDIYDIIKDVNYSENDMSEWAVMQKKFAQEAKKRLKKLLHNRNISLSQGYANYIDIGKKYRLILVRQSDSILR